MAHVSELPNDPTSFTHNRFVVGECVVAIDSVMESPKLAVLSGLLSMAECDALIAEARAAMRPSLVIDERNVDNTEHDTRTSSGMHFAPGSSAVADVVQRKLMSVIGLPMDRAEPLQVLRYGPGEEYVAHFDFFDPDDPDDIDGPPTTLSQYGQRVATMICYLSSVESGGATVFPEVGLEVRPLPGRAVYFTYLGTDGTPDRMSLHGGAPVEAGEKWIITQWCRERPYRATATTAWAPPVSPAADGDVTH
jgi:prolyl 4-hydroxylase